LLNDRSHAGRVLRVLDGITASIEDVQDRRSDEFTALRKGMGYCWSVAVVALPDVGKLLMEKWFSSDDSDVSWIMRENLKKKRLERMDGEWVQQWRSRLEQ
ncbi:MAG: hypothetical protein MUP64_04440, partial [Anaerolineae bacterium]|nr:hypothetical protein [Anaerolineae bacterium]